MRRKRSSIEREVKLPPFPKDGSLLQFDPSAGKLQPVFRRCRFDFDRHDGMVRYTLVVKTPGGAENISYEAIRCDTTEQKAYAFGRRDGTWSNARAPVWRKIRYQDVNRQHGVLYANYFCPGRRPIASVKDAINRFKYGVPYGQPPRSSNRRLTARARAAGLKQDEVVAVDQLRLVDIAQDGFDLARRLFQDAAGFGGAVVDEPARDLAPSGPQQPTTSPRSNSPVTSNTPIGSRLLPLLARAPCTAPASSMSVPRSCR